jgi:hypothetical protein
MMRNNKVIPWKKGLYSRGQQQNWHRHNLLAAESKGLVNHSGQVMGYWNNALQLIITIAAEVNRKVQKINMR